MRRRVYGAHWSMCTYVNNLRMCVCVCVRTGIWRVLVCQIVDGCWLSELSDVPASGSDVPHMHLWSIRPYVSKSDVTNVHR